ncbi:DUF4097 domain-containing protein [Myxococcota bacterium]|nr:DUF4097 domain-containing protein [Myxococcota bacterium]
MSIENPLFTPLMSLAAALVVSAPPSTAFAEKIDVKREATATANVLVTNTSGRIRVTGTDKNEVVVRGSYEEGVEKVEVNGSGDRIEIRVRLREGRFGHVENGEARLDISVPRGARVELETVSADTEVDDVSGRVDAEAVSGDLRITGRPREVDLRTISGNIRVKTWGERGRVRSVSGDIEVEGASGELDCETVSGEVRAIGEALSRARMRSVSGELELETDLKKGADVDMESHSGDVRLRIPGDTPGTYELSAFSGDVRSAIGPAPAAEQEEEPRRRRRHEHMFPGPGEKVRFSQGDGGGRINLNAFSGDVRLEKR